VLQRGSTPACILATEYLVFNHRLIFLCMYVVVVVCGCVENQDVYDDVFYSSMTKYSLGMTSISHEQTHPHTTLQPHTHTHTHTHRHRHRHIDTKKKKQKTHTHTHTQTVQNTHTHTHRHKHKTKQNTHTYTHTRRAHPQQRNNCIGTGTTLLREP
jgi:hypothetical protein